MKKLENVNIVSSKEKNKEKNELYIAISKPKLNHINKFICYKEVLSKKYLKRKKNRFRVDKYKYYYQNLKKDPKSGRWTLKEHIQFLQAIEQFGMNWEKISNVIRTRTHTQICSHAQKFCRKLKKCKSNELGIDFTSKNIKNIKDMISHIKSANKDYNIFTVLLYLSEKYKSNNKTRKKNNTNFNINNILNEDFSENSDNNDNNDLFIEENNEENIIGRGEKINKQIINNNFNNAPINNIYINNIKIFNGFNSSDSLYYNYLDNMINSNFINNISAQNISCNPYNNIYIFNNNLFNNTSNNLSDDFCIFNPIKNPEFNNSEN